MTTPCLRVGKPVVHVHVYHYVLIDMVCLVIVDHLLMPQPGPSGPEVEHSFSSHKDPFQALSVFQYSVLIMMGMA